MSLHSTNYKVKKRFSYFTAEGRFNFLICSAENTFILFPLTLFEPLPLYWRVCPHYDFSMMGRGEVPDVYMTSRRLALASTVSFSLWHMDMRSLEARIMWVLFPRNTLCLWWNDTRGNEMSDPAIQNCYIALIVISFMINVLLLLILALLNEVSPAVLEPDVLCGCRREVLSCLGGWVHKSLC